MIAGLVIWMGLATSTADAAEYREVHLSNGRVIKAEVRAFTPQGVTLGIPQGTMNFPADQLESMEPLVEAEYRSQEPWKIAIMNFTSSDPQLESDARTAHMLARKALSSIPATISGTPLDIPGSFRDADRRALAACKADLLCLIREGEEIGIDVVIRGEMRLNDGEKELRLSALWVEHPTARTKRSIPVVHPLIQHRSEIYESQHTLLSLTAPTHSLAKATVPAPAPVPQQAAPAAPIPVPALSAAPAPEVRKPPKPKPSRAPRTPPSAAAVRAMAWAPVPGLPHLARGDHGAFARSLGVASAGTAIGIGLAGQATYTRGQFVTVSVLSTYAITTLANHLFWPDKTAPQPPPK